jgi:hypothetical protein
LKLVWFSPRPELEGVRRLTLTNYDD